MDDRPNLDPGEAPTAEITISAVLRGKDQSPEETAHRDLEAALQLLAGRAQSVTGASGAAIAMYEGERIICRARAGPMAGAWETQLPLQFSIVEDSMRTQQIVCCRDTENGARADRENCRALGIESIMVLPLIREEQVVGVFELLADKTSAFDDSHGAELERLSEMVLTALDHADAAKRARSEIAAKTNPAPPGPIDSVGPAGSAPSTPETLSESASLKLRSCEACGLPVSEGRTLCVTCEEARSWDEGNLLPPLGQDKEQGWLRSHLYTIGTILIVVLTVVLLWLKLR
jgi:putative methionine-R-sulfoxide reductase with GAF domain